mmetsp:Transcript_162501/g.296695  ORF Transcript_162501/g.296695 Transcript_162501/m.296695 type:complete len:365 (-) Transcript_162501:34-1128(-)
MRNVVLGFLCLVCLCHGRKEQILVAQQKKLAGKDGQDTLKAVARLLLQFNNAAALQPCSRGLCTPAGNLALADVHLQPVASNRQSRVDMQAIDKKAVEAINSRTDFATVKFKHCRELKKLLDEEKNIYLLGYGSGRVEIAEVFADEYLERPLHDVSKVMGIAYPKLDPDFKADNTNLQGVVPMDELMENVDLDELVTLGTDILKRLKHKYTGRVISAWDGTGNDDDYEVMKDGIIIHINDVAPLAEEDLPRIEDAMDTVTTWSNSHKKAPLTIDIDSAQKGKSFISDSKLNARKVAECLLEFLKPGIVAKINFEFELEKLKVSELRKKAKAMKIDEDEIDDADDSDDPRMGLMKLIMAKSQTDE